LEIAVVLLGMSDLGDLGMIQMKVAEPAGTVVLVIGEL
jgi:hypothetical protein